jgi:dihydroorotate dehydrogenase (fumarate)
VEQAGADAIELNISLLPSNPRLTSADYEQRYVEIISKIKDLISIPLALKMSSYSASLANLIQKLSKIDKVAGFVLFNRYYTPDIDIEKMTLTTAEMISTPTEGSGSLRWIALMSGRIDKDLVASTGIHDGAGVVKQILAGAAAVQVVSTVYKNGTAQLNNMLAELDAWMTRKSFSNLDQFRGKLSYEKAQNPEVFERTQFMKYYGGLS